MTNRKNHNSILVLATLGVYLGLVLVGATPQVLAQAAMTRQFSVKDEVEVKDDLDKKPDSADRLTDGAPTETDKKVTSSVRRFLAQFQPVHHEFTPASTTGKTVSLVASRTQTRLGSLVNYLEPDRHLGQFLTVTNLPRADLDPLPLSDAK